MSETSRSRGEYGRCDANARKGTGTGACNRPLDKHGNCDRAETHLSDAPEIPPGVHEADVWNLEAGTRDEPQRPYGDDSCDHCASQIEDQPVITLHGTFCSQDCAEAVRVDVSRCEP